MKKIGIMVIGAGSRGYGYAQILKNMAGEAEVAGVCEPHAGRRRRLAEEFGLPADRCFQDWREIADRPRLADAALICTVEDQHRGPAVALAAQGYHLLLEKPMAPTQEDCVEICRAVKRSGVLLAVCHVLRYTAHFRRMKALLDQGTIGRLRNINATELVGPWHFTHSFVRGNFRNSRGASPYLLAKCCHDMDLLNYFAASRCARATSFGRLSFFTRANQPPGAADRCPECPAEIESACPYSALKIYLRERIQHLDRWPVAMLTLDHTPAGVARALREGPYGRCAFACDNDAPDHQLVNLEFEDGLTAGFVTTAFAVGSRDYFLMGDKGSLRLNDAGLQHYDALSGKTRDVRVDVGDNTILTGHGGGDYGVVRSFIEAVRAGDPAQICTGPEVSLQSHLIVFAAERARQSGRVEPVPTLSELGL
jgi:predicted dehydrogenase